MTPFERRRVVVFRQTGSSQTYWAAPDPLIDLESSSVEWRFVLPLEGAVDLQLVIAQEVAGELALSRSPVGAVHVRRALGVCQTLTSYPANKLALARAAATEGLSWLRLAGALNCALEPTPSTVIFHLRWQQPEQPHD